MRFLWAGFFSTLFPSEALGKALTVPPPMQEHWWAQSSERVPFVVPQLGSMTSHTPAPLSPVSGATLYKLLTPAISRAAHMIQSSTPPALCSVSVTW